MIWIGLNQLLSYLQAGEVLFYRKKRFGIGGGRDDHGDTGFGMNGGRDGHGMQVVG